MKTAISIPDDVFRDAERLAKELNQSRSGLYARAVQEYVARHSADRVTAALDDVSADVHDTEFAKAASERILKDVEW